ncbi:hypothetical protein DCAR_0727121 [Daucus carota subsp. sativus]|uniref:NADH-ubiquinone oxidoreductase chain 3 n=1 Tax=Daucus carota subsp. sativus TaxID=79200 RepID=A0AAF1B7N7_DAUCS|nr:hypothetical protein DCAR_0727121 [Daucus carota subsp. sativus]
MIFFFGIVLLNRLFDCVVAFTYSILSFFRGFNPFGSRSMMTTFLLILTIGSLYEWKRGASDREEEKWRTDRTRALDQCPEKQGVRLPPRKIAKVRLSNRRDIFAHFPGECHNLQEHFMVLIIGGRVKYSPGVKTHYIRGVKDLLGIPDRRSGRSKYGAEKPKSILMEDASFTFFSLVSRGNNHNIMT